MSGKAGESFANLLTRWVEESVARDRLARYGQLLERWGGVHNLVSYERREELVERHLVECFQGARELGERGRLLDVGSGGGLPGVPLLLARPEWSGVLLEPRVKRWAFLREVVRELKLRAEVVRSRYEDWPADGGEFDVICARAIGGYGELLAWARSRLSGSGMVLLWLGEETAAGLRDLEGWRVISSPLAAAKGGLLVKIQACFT